MTRTLAVREPQTPTESHLRPPILHGSQMWTISSNQDEFMFHWVSGIERMNKLEYIKIKTTLFNRMTPWFKAKAIHWTATVTQGIVTNKRQDSGKLGHHSWINAVSLVMLFYCIMHVEPHRQTHRVCKICTEKILYVQWSISTSTPDILGSRVYWSHVQIPDEWFFAQTPNAHRLSVAIFEQDVSHQW